jgi:hypothetical protein
MDTTNISNDKMIITWKEPIFTKNFTRSARYGGNVSGIIGYL